MEKSIACYRAAIQRDPDYPLPYAGLADTFLVQCVNDWAASRERMPPAKECARKALDLAPECGEALTSLACVQSIYDWDWIGAEDGFRLARLRRPAG